MNILNKHKKVLNEGEVFVLERLLPHRLIAKDGDVKFVEVSTYHEDSDAYIPNIRGLQRRGSYFKNFYSNSPVCAASRSATWSGRHVHRIPHFNQGVKVGSRAAARAMKASAWA